MIKLIFGKKGTGKTKKLENLITDAVNNSDGAILCIKQSNTSLLRLPLSANNIRIIDTSELEIASYTMLYGLIAGAVASNYDIKEIFVDNLFKICGENISYTFFETLQKNLLKDNREITFTMSCDKELLPQEFFNKGYIKCI